MAAQICSNCGYEGRGKQIGERSGGGVWRVLGMLTMLPFHTIWKLVGSKSGKLCPHCGMPTMVKLNSNEGRIVQRRIDIEMGLITPPKPKEEIKPVEVAPAEPKVTKKPVNPDEW